MIIFGAVFLSVVVVLVVIARQRTHHKTAWYQPCKKCGNLLLVRGFLQPSGSWRSLVKCTNCWHYDYPDETTMRELPYVRATNAPWFEPYPLIEQHT
jgi:hypothetical protein